MPAVLNTLTAPWISSAALDLQWVRGQSLEQDQTQEPDNACSLCLSVVSIYSNIPPLPLQAAYLDELYI